MKLEEYYNWFLQLENSKRLSKAVSSHTNLTVYLKGIGVDKEQIKKLLNSIVGMFIVADGKVSSKEAEYYNIVFLNSVKGYSPSDIAQAFKDYQRPEYIEQLIKIVNSLDKNAKQDVLTLGIAFLTCDNELTDSEKKLFEKILA